MAITSLDGIVAGLRPPEDVWKTTFTGKVVGGYHSAFYIAGRPGAAAASTAGVAGEALTSYAGQVPFPAAVGGQNVYLARFEASNTSGVGGVTLCDRLWQNSGLSVTATTAQTVGSVAWPARDLDGATAGRGVQIALEVTATMGSGAPLITLSYTNSAGVSGRTATASPSTTSQVGTWVNFPLAAGDVGVRSVESLTLSATMTSGAFSLVAYRPVTTIACIANNIATDRDAIALGMPRFYDNSVPFLVYQLTATAGGIVDSAVTWAQG